MVFFQTEVIMSSVMQSVIYLRLIFLKDIIYLFMRDRERQRHRQREKQAPHREPDVGLDPRTPGSRPGLKAGAKPPSHLGIPWHPFYPEKNTGLRHRADDL